MAAEEEDDDIWDSWEDMADSGVNNLQIMFISLTFVIHINFYPVKTPIFLGFFSRKLCQ